jgi:cellulose synthase/poly-beta-1,6-N-acetylglucosamine synthase-like glycosyltransferase
MTNAFQYIYLIIYLFALLALFTYGMNCYFLMIYYRLNYRKAIREHKEIRRKFDAHLAAKGWPRVTIQLPIYNERYVVERLITSVCHLDS